MKTKTTYFVACIACIALLFGLLGCQAPLPTPTPVPEATATIEPTSTNTPQDPRPTATLLPTAEPLPTQSPLPNLPTPPPPDEGYYRNPELGFSFLYPEGWSVENLGSGLPSAILYDNDDPVQMFVGGQLVEEGVGLEEFALDLTTTFGVSDTVEILNEQAITLIEGVPAYEISFQWTETDEDGDEDIFQAQAVATIANGQGYALVMTARPEILNTRTNTFQAIVQTLTLDQPELYGVSRTNALVLFTDEPITLDPARTQEQAGGIIGHVFSGLVQLDSNLQIIPSLAESWEVQEEGTVYVFTLHDDVAFHNGRSITAQDVQDSWERALSPTLNSQTAGLVLGDITEIEAVDEQTLRVTIDAPKPYFLYKLTQPPAFIVDTTETDWDRPNGSGPFSIRRWAKEEVIILDQFTDYPTPANLDALVYLPFGRFGTSAYEATLLDAAEVAPFNLARVQDPADPLASDLQTTLTLCTTQIVFDTSQAPFDDAEVRQAFMMAINQEQLAQVVLSGGAVPATGFLPPAMPGYLPRTSSFNPEQAAALLAGKTIESVTFTASGTGEPNALVTAVVDIWSTHLGINVEVTLQEPSSYDAIIRNPAQRGNLYLQNWCAAYPDPEAVLDIPFYSSSSANLGEVASDELDNLLETARTESDPAQRLALYQQAESLLLETAVAIPLVHPQQNILVRPYINGFQPSAIPVVWTATVELNR